MKRFKILAIALLMTTVRSFGFGYSDFNKLLQVPREPRGLARYISYGNPINTRINELNSLAAQIILEAAGRTKEMLGRSHLNPTKYNYIFSSLKKLLEPIIKKGNAKNVEEAFAYVQMTFEINTTNLWPADWKGTFGNRVFTSGSELNFRKERLAVEFDALNEYYVQVIRAIKAHEGSTILPGEISLANLERLAS